MVKEVGRKIKQVVYLGTAPEGEEGDEEQDSEGGWQEDQVDGRLPFQQVGKALLQRSTFYKMHFKLNLIFFLLDYKI